MAFVPVFLWYLIFECTLSLRVLSFAEVSKCPVHSNQQSCEESLLEQDRPARDKSIVTHRIRPDEEHDFSADPNLSG